MPAVSDDEEEENVSQPVEVKSLVISIPPYGQRRSWRPSKQIDFGMLELLEKYLLINGHFR